MRRLLVGMLAVLALVAGATVAEAAIKTFAGTTSAADPIGFKVDSKGSVYSFYFEGVHLTCTDGDEFDSGTGTQRIRTPRSQKFKVTARKFKINVREEENSRGWDISGKFKRGAKGASGTLTVFANFDEQNAPNPEGPVECTSGALKWSVKRK
jgi:hypothetical protein